MTDEEDANSNQQLIGRGGKPRALGNVDLLFFLANFYVAYAEQKSPV